ncbi:FAD-dependent oxidoreductase [Microbacterium suaedae]|uniref:FAD-dependent oxidoreductase n=1 Tax=Microbacterium suaedae TaxID=2067813 RepID=UPI000DA23740|nr:NAD(P)/FAD-dependent oxidoreductase [Microbacterium suaedae]
MSGAPDHDVVVIGAGPTGLLLASELRRRGVDVALLERRSDGRSSSRAIGVHPPVLAALEDSGATERILSEAVRIPRGVARTRENVLGEVRFDRLRTRFPFVASLPQSLTTAAVAAEAPVPRRGVRAVALDERGGRVEILTRTRSSDDEISARFVVVAAGSSGRALVPAGARMRLRPGRDCYLMADVAGGSHSVDHTAVVTLDRAGVLESFPLPHGARRYVAWDRRISRREAASDGGSGTADTEKLRRTVASLTGSDEAASEIEQATAFRVQRALVPRMRVGRILVIGDTAHEVSPIGGQGMNLGLLDAATLAPLLAARIGDPEIDESLHHWERARLASARTADRLANLNTALGRARAALPHRVVTSALSAGLTGPFGSVAARAFAMGFDCAAKIRPPSRS